MDIGLFKMADGLGPHGPENNSNNTETVTKPARSEGKINIYFFEEIIHRKHDTRYRRLINLPFRNNIQLCFYPLSIPFYGLGHS